MSRLASPPSPSEGMQSHLAISVNMGNLGGLSGSSAAVRQFVQLIGDHHLNTTWIIDHPRHLSWVATLQERQTRHDLALNFTWASRELSRSQFQNELDERWRACRQVANLPKVAYSCEPDFLRTRLNLLNQIGLTTCITNHTPNTRRGRSHSSISKHLPRPLPLGMWQLPTNLNIPWNHTWLRSPASHIPRASRGQLAAHIHALIDAEQVVAQGNSGHRQLEKFLRNVAWEESADHMKVVTAAQWTQSTAVRNASTPQRSILRTAA